MNQSTDPERDIEHKCGIRAIWLATMSVVAAVFIELPVGIEPSLLYGPLRHGSILSLLAAKITCLTIIFLPLAIYVVLNGLKAVKCVREQIAIVVVIVAISLAHNLVMLWCSVSK